MPAQNYISDSAGAGADAFDQIVYITTKEDGWYTAQMESDKPIAEDSVTYMDQIFTDDSHDSETIDRIGYSINSRTQWDGSVNSNVCVSDALNKFEKGDQIAVYFVEDSRDELDIPEISGTITMTPSTGGWHAGYNAYGSVDLPAPDGITYGSTTVGDLLDNYKQINVPSYSVYSYGLDGLTADMVRMSFNINITNGTDTTSLYQDGIAAEKSSILFTDSYNDIENYRDWKINSISLDPQMNMEWDNELGTNVPVFPDYRDAATKKLPFDIQITEDKRSALALPGKTGTVYMHAYTDSDYAEGALADGETSLGNIDGVTYGTTTIQDLVDRYKSFTLPEIPFYSSSVEGLTRDLLQCKVIFRVKDTDGRITATYADMDIDLDGAAIPTGALLPGSIVSAYGSCTIADIALSVSAKTEKNSDGKEVTICEAVRNMQPGGEIAIELTQDTRASVTISAPQGDMEMYVCNSDENSDISGWCEGGWAFSDIVYYPDNVVSGETTVGDLKKMYNVINVSAPKYESDTEDIGSSGFVYNINIKTKSGDDYSGDEVDYDSAGTFYIDRILENAADDLVIDDICLRISSRMETNPDTGKQQAVSEKIRSMKDGTTFLIVNEDPREVLNVSVNANKVTLTAYDDGDGSGVNVRGSISAGNDAIGMTLADFFAKYKEINFAAPGYVSDSIGAGKDAFKAIVNIRAAAPDSAVDFVRLNWVVFQLDEGGWHSIKMYEDYFLPDYKDYTIDSIDVEFVSTVDDDGKAVSEKIRSLNIGDEVTVTLKSSERKVYSFDSLSAKNATIEYKGSGNESKVDLYVTDSPLIGMTVAEMVDAYIGCQMKAPGYYGDTANAGKDAFSYKMNILALAPGVSEGDYSNMCWLD